MLASAISSALPMFQVRGRRSISHLLTWTAGDVWRHPSPLCVALAISGRIIENDWWIA